MKHIFSLFLLALMSIFSAQACVKKAPSVVSPLTVIVMDTTQALLADAQIQVGKTVYRTSWDGRVVFKPEQLAGVSKLLISCDRHEAQKLTLSDALPPVVTIRLIPKKEKAPKDHYVTLGAIRTRHGEEAILYSKMAKSADGAVVNCAVMPDNTPASAGLLTAGEVNDFARWQAWENYLQSTEAFQQTWGFVPRQRYTIQVMNQAGYPVVNYPVQITDDNGNTLFQAVTDNTGKAELWGKEGHETLIVDEPCDAPEGVDVVFIFDATGSMGDELRYLQAEMKDVIARAKEATGGLAIRTGAVVYRDHGDEYVTRISRLTDDIATTQAFIDKQHASGGGDYPEAVPEALMAALNSAGWDENARARIAFLILDAPCHEDSATIALLHDQILNAAALGVRLVPVVCSGIGESGEYLLRSIALATNGTSFFLTDDSGIGLSHLKPTTDSLTVEHLNDMMVRTIIEFSAMPSCETSIINHQSSIINFLPNPFETSDLDSSIINNQYINHLYIVDISGKLISIVEGSFDDFEISNHQSSIINLQLPIGIYFVKAYINGEWHTRKFLIQ
jgi:hypothetical protein